MILLAGIVLALALVTTSIGLTQLNEAAGDSSDTSKTTFVEEWRFIRERTRDVYASAIGLTSDASSVHEVLNTTVLELEFLQNGRGFDMIAIPANGSAPTSELDLVNGANRYDDLVTLDGKRLYGAYDGTNDGYIWTDGGAGYLQAVVLYYYFSNTQMNLTEIAIISVNAEPSGAPTAPRYLDLNSGIPSGVSVGAGNAAYVTLDWNAPASPGGGPIRSYTIYADNTLIATVDGDVYTYNDTARIQGTLVDYAVRANNAYGASDSASGNITPGQPPYAPSGLTATPDDTGIDLSWSAPASGSASLTGYYLYRGTNPSALGYLSSTGSSTTTYEDNTAVPGTSYYYAVRGRSAVGSGSSATVGPVVRVDEPGAPRFLIANAGNTNVTVTWSAPQNDGGAAITDYHVARGPSAASLTRIASVGTALQYLDTGLTNTQQYYYAITAENTAGEGPGTTAVAATPQEAPSPPNNPLATPSGGSITLTWDAPTFVNGTISAYRVYNETGASPVLMTQVATTSATLTGLHNGYTYSLSVSAVSTGGEGASTIPLAAIPWQPAAAPTSLTATPDNGENDLTWTLPTDTGGFPITAVRVYGGATDPPTTLIASIAPGTSYSHTTVVAGVTYHYRVAAVTTHGEGTRSSVASATAATAPGVPLLPAAVGSPARIDVSWTPPTLDGWSPITNYKIYRGTSPLSLSLLATVGDTSSYADTSVTNLVTYYYTISAVNALGESAQSTVTSGMPVGAPSAPLNLAAVGLALRIDLTWDEPASDGGSAITSYRVYGGTSPNPTVLIASVSAPTLSYSATVPALVTWHYRVTAVNAEGESTYSNEVSAMATLI